MTKATEVTQPDPKVVFQRIVPEGLASDGFLRRLMVTYDLPREHVIFGGAARAV